MGVLRIVGAYRDTEVRPGDPLGLLLADLAQAGLARHHALGPLAPQEAAALLADLLGGIGAGNRAVAERVLQRAGGTPFVLVSYAQALRQGRAEAVPWDVAQGVRQRVALLPQTAQELLGAAAIVGRQVPRALLVALAGQPEEAVLAGLEAACRARLLREEGEEAYAFAHDNERSRSASRWGIPGRSRSRWPCAAGSPSCVGTGRAPASIWTGRWY
jgi:predicted ATPase